MWMQKMTVRSFRVDKYIQEIQNAELDVMNARTMKEEEIIDDEF